MERAIPLGRVAGIHVGMSWVVPLVAALYAFVLSQSLLPAEAAGHDSTSYWAVGIGGAALFFLSLLAHEMGHALVGRREGMGVRGITLTLLGGHTQFETEPTTPGAELRVSAIGPVTNLVLAGVFAAAASALSGGTDGLTVITGAMLGWLAFVNLLLALVNMLPGAPLDGGAVLEALLWMATRDRNRAAMIASGIGVALGAVLGVLGFVVLRSGGPVGLWMLIGGVFIAASARARMRSAPAVGRLRDTTVGTVMTGDPPVVPEWTTLGDVAMRAEAWRPHTAFPVQAPDGRITGLLTAELVMAVDRGAWHDVRAGDVAWPVERIPVARVDDPLLHALQRADSAGVDRILVVWPDGRVAGTAGRDAARLALAGPPSSSR